MRLIAAFLLISFVIATRAAKVLEFNPSCLQSGYNETSGYLGSSVPPAYFNLLDASPPVAINTDPSLPACFKFLSFTGAPNSLLVVRDGPSITPSVLPRVSLELFVRLNSIVNNQGWVVGCDNGEFDRSIILHDGRYGSRVAFGVGYPYLSTLPTSDSLLGVWTHIVGTFENGATNSFYVNGTANVQNLFVSNDENNPAVSLGGLTNFGDHQAHADVAIFRIYDHILTAQEVDAAYAAAVESVNTCDSCADSPLCTTCPCVQRNSRQCRARLPDGGCGSGVEPNPVCPSANLNMQRCPCSSAAKPCRHLATNNNSCFGLNANGECPAGTSRCRTN